jgi:tetratricopeptide (TPR) repeat protein
MRAILLPLLLGSAIAVAQDDAMLAGLSALRKDDHRAAEEAFTRAVDRTPDDLRTWYYRGVNRLLAGDAQGALSDLDRALVLVPNDAHSLLRRAEAHAALGSVAAARKDLNALLEHQPNGPAAEHALLSLGNFAMAEGDLRRAHVYYDQLVRIAPHNPLALADRGITLAALERDAEALEDLDLALERDPSLAQAHAHRGIILLRLGRRQEACHAFHEAHAWGDRSVEEMLLVHCDR